MRLSGTAHVVTMVPIAAILVAGIRLTLLDVRLPEQAGRAIFCDAAPAKGEEMGWLEHGSTIIVFAPASFAPCEAVLEGGVIRMGQPLMRLP